MKLNKFGKLYLNHAKDMSSGEISVITFISQICSTSMKEYKKDPSVPPVFKKIPTDVFIDKCGISRRGVFDSIKKLIDKGLIMKKTIKGRAHYFPADKYSGEYYGMIQEESMIKLTKNEKLVYGYLSACQGQGKSCEPKISQIISATGMKSKQMVSKTITSLVRKDVIIRVVNPKKSSTYFVKRFEKESAENLLPKSAENLSPKVVESAENVHHLNNNLLKEDNNSVFNNPSRGEKLNFFEKIPKDNIDISENFKKRKKENILVLESSHISFRKESVPKYRILLMTYISTLSPESIDYMKDQGCDLNSFINLHINEFLKSGLTDFRIIPEDIEKISENDKKCLQEYIDKQNSNISDFDFSLLEDVIRFNRFNFTIGLSARMKLRSLINSIKAKKEKIIFKIDNNVERKPW